MIHTTLKDVLGYDKLEIHLDYDPADPATGLDEYFSLYAVIHNGQDITENFSDKEKNHLTEEAKTQAEIDGVDAALERAIRRMETWEW